MGYLLKGRVAGIGEFVEAVRRVARGGCVMDHAIVAQLLARRRHQDPLAELTEQEREVLGLTSTVPWRSNDAKLGIEGGVPDAEAIGNTPRDAIS